MTGWQCDYDSIMWLWPIYDTESYQTLILAFKIKINRKANKSEKETETLMSLNMELSLLESSIILKHFLVYKTSSCTVIASLIIN